MTGTEESIRVQHNPRQKLQGRTLSNWSYSDRRVLLLIAATFGLLWWQVSFELALLSLLLLVFLFRSSRGYGRLYQDLASDMSSKWRSTFHKGIWWRADDSSGSRFARYLRSRRSPLKAQFVRISSEIDGKIERFCVLHQTDRPYDHLFITARGGAFASADVNDRTRLVVEMNSLLDQIIAQSDLKAGISHLRITSPYNQMKLAKNFEDGASPLIARPELFELDEETSEWVKWARENARQIPLELEKYYAAEVLSFIVITIRRDTKWGEQTNQQIQETPIIELGKALIDGLRGNTSLELKEVHSPSLPEAALIARSSWDVTGISGYYRRREYGLIPTTDEEVDEILSKYQQEAEIQAQSERNERKRKAIIQKGVERGAQEVDRLLEAWPQQCIETDQSESFLRFDDNYIAILRFVELPEQFRSDQIALVHSVVKNTWTRFAFVSESVSGSTQADFLLFQASLQENFNKAFYANRVVRDPRMSARSKNILNQLDHMSVNTIAQMANGLVVIVERDPQRLRRAVKEVSAKYGRIGFKAKQVKGSARLIDYFFTGALAANRA